MPCNCKNAGKQQVRRATLPRPTAAIIDNPAPQSDLPAFGPGEDLLTTDRRRIERLRREAVRRSLGIG